MAICNINGVGGERLSVQLIFTKIILKFFFSFKCKTLFKMFHYSIYYTFVSQCGQVNRAMKALTLFHLVLKSKGLRILAFSIYCLIFYSIVNVTECEAVLHSSLPERYYQE